MVEKISENINKKDIKIQSSEYITMKSDNSALGPASTFTINENTTKSNIYSRIMKGIVEDRDIIAKRVMNLVSNMKLSLGSIRIVNDNNGFKVIILPKNQNANTVILSDKQKIQNKIKIEGGLSECFRFVDYYVDIIKKIDLGFLENFSKSDVMAIMDKETLFGKFRDGTGSDSIMQITKFPVLQISEEIKKDTTGYKNMFSRLFPQVNHNKLPILAENHQRKSNDINSIKIALMYLNFCYKNKIKYSNFSSYKLSVKDMFLKNHPNMDGFFDKMWSKYISLLSSSTTEGKKLKNSVQAFAKYNGNDDLKYSYGLYVGFVSKYIYNKYNNS